MKRLAIAGLVLLALANVAMYLSLPGTVTHGPTYDTFRPLSRDEAAAATELEDLVRWLAADFQRAVSERCEPGPRPTPAAVHAAARETVDFYLARMLPEQVSDARVDAALRYVADRSAGYLAADALLARIGEHQRATEARDMRAADLAQIVVALRGSISSAFSWHGVRLDVTASEHDRQLAQMHASGFDDIAVDPLARRFTFMSDASGFDATAAAVHLRLVRTLTTRHVRAAPSMRERVIDQWARWHGTPTDATIRRLCLTVDEEWKRKQRAPIPRITTR